MKIKLTRTIDLDRQAVIDFMSDIGYDEEIAEQGDAFIREYIRDWIWFSGSGGLEDQVMRYTKDEVAA
jgi:hypothetical protein